jgi:hypothetical protein
MFRPTVPIGGWLCVLLLVVLLGLQCFWMLLLLKMVFKKLSAKPGESLTKDIRSDSDDDDNSTNSSKKDT